jgi:rare lipoprotein A (peptidoglycan hydrolase)
VLPRIALAAAACVLVAAAPAQAAATLGARPLKKGDHGNDVAVLQRILVWKRWSPGPVDGFFGRQTKRAVKHFQRHRRIDVDGKVGPQTIGALAGPWRVRRATLFGPGLYGNRTACGQTLRRRTLGIAHRTLRCGRRVPTFHNGRIAILPVIDRGPFTNGVQLDLTTAAGRKLRMTTTGNVRAGY